MSTNAGARTPPTPQRCPALGGQCGACPALACELVAAGWPMDPDAPEILTAPTQPKPPSTPAEPGPRHYAKRPRRGTGQLRFPTPEV